MQPARRRRSLVSAPPEDHPLSRQSLPKDHYSVNVGCRLNELSSVTAGISVGEADDVESRSSLD